MDTMTARFLPSREFELNYSLLHRFFHQLLLVIAYYGAVTVRYIAIIEECDLISVLAQHRYAITRARSRPRIK